MRYLAAAFVAQPRLFGLRMPWNVLFVIVGALAGMRFHAVWIAAAVVEALYLLAVASHPGFRQWVDGSTPRSISATQHTAATLGGPARERLQSLEDKCRRVEAAYRARPDDLLFESNLAALRELTQLYGRLLVAQRTLRTTAPGDLDRQIASMERELAAPSITPTLRGSRETSLELLRSRRANQGRRDEALAEIESDLGRIEQQVDLALEDAALDDRPRAISGRIDLVSAQLTRADDVSM